MGWQDYLPQGSNDPRSIGSRVGRKVGELNEWRKSIKDRWQKAENYRILKQQGKPIPLELEAFIAGERAKDVPAQVDPNATALPYNPLDPANPANKFSRGKEEYQRKMGLLGDMQVENVVPRVPDPNDNPFTGQVTIDGKPPTDAQMGRFKRDRWGRGEWESNFGQPPEQPVAQQQPSMFDDIKEYMFAGKDQQGLFGQAGIDPKTKEDRGSMGLGGAFGRLFNDPSRMAMLSGGLTALDPSSYYDKEGFGSPWTGLRSGLGGAQAGYKSVIDRRKAEADTALAKAKTAAEGQSSQKFKSAQIGDATFMYSDADIQKRRNELMADGKIGWREATNKAIMETGTRIEKGIAPKSMYDIRVNFDKGQSHLENIDNLLNMAEDSFNTGAVGFGKRGYDKFRGFFSMEGDTTEATQLVTGINRIISQNWKELVGGGQLTPRDIEFIKSVVKTPESLGTTAAEVRASLTELRKILKKAQTNRAKTLGIKDYDPTQRISPNLGSVGGTAKSFIDSISPR